MGITAVTTIFGNTLQWDKSSGDNISHYRIFRRSDATTPSDTDFIGEVAGSDKPSYLDLFSDLTNREIYRYYIKTVALGGQSSIFSRVITATTTESINIGSTATLSVAIEAVNITLKSTGTAAQTQTKTWTTTTDFNEGTLANLVSTSARLSLAATTAAGTWGVGGALSTGRRYAAGAGASEIDGLAIGGYVGTGIGSVNTEEYNGTAWGAGGDLAISRYAGVAAGVLASAIVFGGLSTGLTMEEYDGTNWSSGVAFNSDRRYLGGLGVADNALAVGGFRDGSAQLTTELYGGVAWAGSSDLPVGKYAHGAAGLSEAALVFGGLPGQATSYEFDGVAWAVGGTLTSGRQYCAGFGVQALAIAAGGYTGAVTGTSEEYNGTGWTAGGALNTSRYATGGGGAKAGGLCFGGLPTASMTVTEEYTGGVATSGTWTIDLDTTADSSFGNIDLSETGAGTVKARIKTATAQGTLGAASWVPATGYYTSFPAAVTASDNRWYRLEIALSSSVSIEDVTQEWTPDTVAQVSLEGQISIPFQQKTNEPTGFENRTDSVISFDNGTRTFSISPAATSYTYWQDGEKFTITSATTVQIENTTGIAWIYFDSENLVATSNITETQIDTLFKRKATVISIYWNTATSTSVYLGEERHGIQMDGQTHEHLHHSFGTIIRSGVGLNTITADASGATDNHAQFGTATGEAADEDIELSVTANASTTGLTLYYKNGSTSAWVTTTNAGFSIATTGTGRMAYNQNSGGTWSLTEVTNNRFALCHVFVSTEINNNMIAVIGENEYTTLNNARSGATTEINTLLTGDLPGLEIRAVGTVIFQTSNAYGNAVKSRIRSTGSGDDWIDFRTTLPSGRGVSLSDHGGLSGLGDDDHSQYLNINGRTADQSISGNILISSNLTIGGNSSVSGTLHVSGATTMGSSLTVSGATILNSTLAVTGTVTLHSTLAVTGAVTFGDAIFVANTSNLIGHVGIGITSITTAIVQIGEAFTTTSKAEGVGLYPSFSPDGATTAVFTGLIGYAWAPNTAGWSAGNDICGLSFGVYGGVFSDAGSGSLKFCGLDVYGSSGYNGISYTDTVTGIKVQPHRLPPNADGQSLTSNTLRGIHILDADAIGTGIITNHIALDMEHPGQSTSVATNIYQTVLRGFGANSGIWFNGFGNYSRI